MYSDRMSTKAAEAFAKTLKHLREKRKRKTKWDELFRD